MLEDAAGVERTDFEQQLVRGGMRPAPLQDVQRRIPVAARGFRRRRARVEAELAIAVLLPVPREPDLVLRRRLHGEVYAGFTRLAAIVRAAREIRFVDERVRRL